MNTETVENSEAKNQFFDAAKEKAQHAFESAKETGKKMKAQCGEKMAQTDDYVRHHPMPLVIGALVGGFALGYLIVTSRRELTFRERFIDEPLHTARDATSAALAPVARRLHTWSDQARHMASNLKFW